MSKKRVLLGMSGGIDSSLAAILLLEQGYEVVGFTMQMWENDHDDPRKLSKEIDTIHEAKRVAEKLGIKHFTIDISEKFKKDIIHNFISEYLEGRTPNPCSLCNTKIKWPVLLEKANELDCQFIATGHYAKVGSENGVFFIQKAADNAKDQSYFLWGLKQEQLSRILLPLGKYTKEQIKKLASEKGFNNLVHKKESQEICFIHDNDYRRFLREKNITIDDQIGKGNFISTDGKVLGQHMGYPFYTIGQRKGLQIALGEPMYVVNINASKNEITLGRREDIQKKEMWVKNLNLIKYNPIPQGFEVKTKVRYRSEAILSILFQEKDKIKVIFNDDVFAITPGQSAVFYEEDDLIGGGIIE